MAILDAVVEIIGGVAELKVLSRMLFNVTVEAAKQYRPPHAPKLTYICTTGIWVHGDNREDIVTDTTPLVNPISFTSWRPEHEQRVVHNAVVNGIVIRPALLYGRSGSILATMFKKAYEGRVEWYGTPGGRYSLIHCDDLADMYVLATEKAAVVGGTIFDAANDFTESVDDILHKLVQVSGAQGPYQYIAPSNRESILVPKGMNTDLFNFRLQPLRPPLLPRASSVLISHAACSAGSPVKRVWLTTSKSITMHGKPVRVYSLISRTVHHVIVHQPSRKSSF